MMEKFEIKSHDGPGRIGKLNGEKTPKLFYKDELKIAPSEGSAYNIDKEIAKFNIEETVRLAEENVDKCNAAVIQGSKYINLRIECMKKLEEIGYNIFIVANSDELLTNPRELVDIIVNLRKNSHNAIKRIHRLVAEAFIENPNKLPCINHIDGNKQNNHIDNLEWCSYSHNNRHAREMGLNKGIS